jgi:gluconate 2-dehydrogenase gamma chain
MDDQHQTIKDLETMTALADTIFPAGDGVGSASELGAVDYVVRRLGGPWGRGEDRYLSPPFIEPPHGGHGSQSSAQPIDLVDQALDDLRNVAESRLGAPFADLARPQRNALVAELSDGRLAGADGAAAFAIVREVVMEGVLADPRHGGNRGGAAWAWLGYHPAHTDLRDRWTA